MSAEVQFTPRKQLSILIIQLGEMEEVFRSLMALKAIKHLYPDAKIHVIARAETAAPLKRVDWLASVLEIPAVKKNSGEDPVTKIARWIDQVINENYDILTNWTYAKRYSRMAAVATALIPAMVKLGDYLREDMTFASFDAWSMYRQAWLKEGVAQDIHHTDIITTQLLTALQIHAGDPAPEAGSSAVTSRYFFKNTTMSIHTAWAQRPKNLKWIALHVNTVGEKSAEFIDQVLRRHPDAGVVLLSEVDQLDFEFMNPRVINLVGQVHLDQLINILSHCSWVVAGKSAIVDLASLMNIRTLFWIQAQPAHANSLLWTEDGPYGNSHAVVQTTDDTAIDALYATWSYFNSEWFHKGSLPIAQHFANLGLTQGLTETQIYRSRIRTPNEGGGVCYEKISPQAHTFEAWMYRIRGQVARNWFCGWLPPIDEEVARIRLNPALIKKVRELGESIQVMKKLSWEGKAFAKELMTLSEGIKNSHLMSVEDRNQIDEFAHKLLEVEGLMTRVSQVEPELRGMVKWYQQMMHNLNGTNLTQMAKETFHAFELIEEGVELVNLYAQKTLEQAKPKSIRTPLVEVPRSEV
jgi:ADP-heptose:LPS heptosyltransferase